MTARGGKNRLQSAVQGGALAARAAFRNLYDPRNMVREELKQGDIPGPREAYATAVNVAWAAVAETFLISLISMADTVMVSVIGEEAIAAVGLVTQPRFLVMTLVTALNTAVTAITARRKGENNARGASDCLKQGIVLSALISLAACLLVSPFTEPLLRFVGAQDDAIGMSKTYFDTLLRALPVLCVSLTISAALRGTGNTKASMAINMSSNLVNLAFNYLLIGGNLGFPALGVRGAALATDIGWSVGLLLGVCFVTRRGAFLSVLSTRGWAPERENLRSVFKVASGTLVEQLCMRAGFMMYGMIVAGLGTLMFAAHQILSNIMSLSFSFGEGYGIAASSLVGQNLGRKRPDLSIVYGKICQRLSFLTSTAVFLVLALFGRHMMRAFTDDATIVETGGRVMVIMVAIIYLQASQMIFMGSLRGAGDTRYTAVVSLVCIAGVRPAISWSLAYAAGVGLLGAWVGFLVDQALRLYFTFRRFSSGKWVKIKL